jgi:hypothetical protein
VRTVQIDAEKLLVCDDELLEDVSLEDIGNELPETSPRYIVLSYKVGMVPLAFQGIIVSSLSAVTEECSILWYSFTTILQVNAFATIPPTGIIRWSKRVTPKSEHVICKCSD